MRASVESCAPEISADAAASVVKIASTRATSPLKRRDRFAVRGGAGFHLSGLRGGLLDFKIQLLEAARQFRGALPVEENAILAAVQFERRLPEHVLVLPQFAFQFIRARAKPLLLGFPSG